MSYNLTLIGGGYVSRMIVKHLLGSLSGCTINRLTVLTRSAMNGQKLILACDNDPRLNVILGDACDDECMKQALEGANRVINTAANKYVDLCESNIRNAVRSNIDTVECLIRNMPLGVRVIHLSTDKVNHPSVYGATKLIAERMAIEAGFCVVRCGNVFGSDGSVLPLWRDSLVCGHSLVCRSRTAIRWVVHPRKLLDILFSNKPEAGKVFIPECRSVSMGDLLDECVRVWPDEVAKNPGIVSFGTLQPMETQREILTSSCETSEVIHEGFISEPCEITGDDLRKWIVDWDRKWR